MKVSGSSLSLHPYAIIGCYCFVNAFHGYIVGAADAVKQLMIVLGVGRELDPVAQADFLADILNIGVTSSLLLGVPLGMMLDTMGPRFTCLFGTAANAGAFALWGLSSSKWWHYLGGVFIGIPPITVLNSHLSVANLFPSRPALILGVLGAFGELSSFMPLMFKDAVNAFGPHTSVVGFLVISGCTMIISYIVVPTKIFERPDPLPEASILWNARTRVVYDEELFDPSTASTASSESALVSSRRTDHRLEQLDSQKMAPLEHFSAKRQIMSSPFLLYAVLFVFNVFRRTYFSQRVREIYSNIAADDGRPEADASAAADMLNFLLCIPFHGFVFFYLTDIVGFWWMAASINLLGGIMFASCAWLPLSWQWISMVCYVQFIGFVFGQMTVFVTGTYGYKNLGLLQGFQNFVALLGVWTYNPFIVVNEQIFGGDHRDVCATLTFFSAAAAVLPTFCSYLVKRTAKLSPPPREEEGQSEHVLPITA